MATKLWVGTDTGNEGDWGVAANWSPAGVPVNADDVYLENSNQDVTDTLDQSAVVLDSLNIAQSFTGNLGTAAAYFQVDSAEVNIGAHFGPGEAAGSSLIKLDVDDTECKIIVFDSGLSEDTTRPAIRLLCNNAATTLEVRKGEVGLAIETGETSTLLTVEIGYVSDVEIDANVYIGAGVTMTNLTKKGGFCMLRSAVTTIKNYAGSLTTEGAGAVVTLNAYGGVVVSNSIGTITTCNITIAGEVDFTKSAQLRTVTNLLVDDEGVIAVDPAVVTLTNNITSNKPVRLRASAA